MCVYTYYRLATFRYRSGFGSCGRALRALGPARLPLRHAHGNRVSSLSAAKSMKVLKQKTPLRWLCATQVQHFMLVCYTSLSRN